MKPDNPNLMSMSQLDTSSCNCDQCRQTCLSAPGICAPGDIERIAAYVGATGDDFVFDNFKPLGGPQVSFGGDEPVNVPVIAPQQHEDGRCVFYKLNPGRCSIYSVRPRGCRDGCACRQNVAAVTEEIARDVAEDCDYLDLWTGLVYDTRDTCNKD